jgi:hypothetical protein
MDKAKWIPMIGLCVIAAGAGTAEARTRPGFEIGGELFDYRYRERFEGETIVRDDGTFGGLTFGYVETIGGGSFLRVKLGVSFGSVDYSSEDGNIDNVSQSIGQLELHFGRDFDLGGSATLTPFVGIGARVLEDRSGGEETERGFSGYDREIGYSYVPVGAAATFRLREPTTLTVSAQYNWVVGGEARSALGDLDSELPDLKLNIDKGHGMEVSALLSAPIGRNAIVFGPFVRHWRIGRSDGFVLRDPEGSGEAIEFFEPKNRTTEVGVKLGLAF